MGWLTEVDAAVTDLRTAAQAASLYVPVSRGAAASGNFDRVNPIRLADAAAALACHAAMKLLGGLAPASWSDAEALWRLGQLVARAATAGEYAVAEAFWKAALIATVDLAASPATSPELLSTMQAGLGAKLGFPPATETWMFHRLEALEANGTPRVAPARAAKPGRPAARWRASAPPRSWKRSTRSSTRSTSRCKRPIPQQRIARVEQAAPTMAAQAAAPPAACSASRSRPSRTSGSRCSRLRWPGGSATVASCPRRWPSWPDPPKDPGSGGAFIYTVDGGRYRLYGVGGDGRDDHGAPEHDVVVDAREPPRFAAP